MTTGTAKEVLGRWGLEIDYDPWETAAPCEVQGFEEFEREATQALATATGSGRADHFAEAMAALRKFLEVVREQRPEGTHAPPRVLSDLWKQADSTYGIALISNTAADFEAANKLLEIQEIACALWGDQLGHAGVVHRQGRMHWCLADCSNEDPAVRLEHLRLAAQAFSKSTSSAIHAGAPRAPSAAAILVSAGYGLGMVELFASDLTRSKEGFEVAAATLHAVTHSDISRERRALSRHALGRAWYEAARHSHKVEPKLLRDAAVAYQQSGMLFQEEGDKMMAAESRAAAGTAFVLLGQGGRELSRFLDALEEFEAAAGLYGPNDPARAGEAKARANEIRELLEEWSSAEKLDKTQVLVDNTVTSNLEEAGIADDSVAVETTAELGEDFAAAVARAREAAQVVASRLQERLDQARRFMPTEAADREELVRQVEEALALGVEIRVDGQRSTKLKIVKGSPIWRIGSSGGLGFRKHTVEVSVPSVEDPEVRLKRLEM